MHKITTRSFDIANHLADEDDMAEYLAQVMEEGDAAELADTLSAIARARGMAQLAQDTGPAKAG